MPEEERSGECGPVHKPSELSARFVEVELSMTHGTIPVRASLHPRFGVPGRWNSDRLTHHSNQTWYFLP